METAWTQDVVKITVVRLIVVAFTIVAFGFLFFRLSVFDLRVIPSQFVTSGVTASVFFAALASPRRRDGYIALLVWYAVLTFLVGRFTLWQANVYGAYVAGVAAAVYVYNSFVRREIVRGGVQRVASAGVLMAIANAVIMVYLGLFSWHTVFASTGFFASMVFRNLQFGTLIGIAFGIGAEFAGYIIRRMKRTAG
jgi:hypothetical protein